MDLSFFFDPGRPTAYFLNGLILTLTGAAGVQLLWSYVRQLRAERTGIGWLRNQDVLDREGVGTLARQLPPRSQLLQRIRLLEQLHRRHQRVNADALAAISAEAFRQQTSFARYVASTLVLLGLTGTLWGLGTAVHQLALSFGAESGLSIQSIRDGIFQTLGGMTTAFSTTLAGVFGSVVVVAAVRVYSAAASEVVRDLEAISISALVPLYDTSEAGILDIAAQRLDSLTKVFEERLSNLAVELENRGNALELTVRRGVEGLIEKFTARTSELLRSFEATRDQMTQLLGDPDSAEGSVAASLERVAEAAAGLDGAATAARELVPELRTGIIQALGTGQQEFTVAMQGHASQLRELLEEHVKAAEQIARGTDTLAKSGADMAAAAQSLGGDFTAIKKVWSDSAGAVSRLEQEVSLKLAQIAKAVGDHAAAAVREQSAAQKAVLDSLQRFEDSLRAFLRTLDEEPQRHARQAEELVSELRDALDRQLPQVAATLARSQREINAQIQEALLRLSRELRVLGVPSGSGHTTVRPTAAAHDETSVSEREPSRVLAGGSSGHPEQRNSKVHEPTRGEE